MKSLVALVLAGSASVASAAVEDSSAASALAVPPALREKSIHEGDMELGGGFTLGKTNSNRASSTSLSLHPQVEYFVQDKLSIGGALQFWSYDFEYSDSESKSSGVGIGPSLTV
jgi:hypothetical protein